ncbi:TetR/AcrR family transcriptional regulator [Danxiaibacter flavus]|uniref:TetR/AcrR family transcriptional regulator n=1 Tax=Danxiaibacter flavus TaxID=3049108 RepID=A0ABV3ZJB0_9BACT|nr:TetR/AcrR family transcriptional regulator [Chitinophagaceae bacterium DXS]
MSKAAQTRQFIIERSAPLFNKKGIEATAMSDIMAVTKLSKGSLYVHFKDKEQLAQAVVDYNLQLLDKKVSAAISKVPTAKGKLLAFIDILTNVMYPPVEGGCPMINFGMEADDTNPAINKQILTAIERAQKTIVNIIERGTESGEFSSDKSPREFATIMFAMIEGGVVMSRVAGNNNKMKIIVKYLKAMIDEQLK